MFKTRVKSIFLHGEQIVYHLFKIAIHFAESGLNVWFISPKQFNKLPENIQCPEKDILKLITFLYIQDATDLLKQTNNIHSWHKMPNVIICNEYNSYVRSWENPSKTAFITSSLIDAANTCAEKHKNKTYLIVSCNELAESNLARVQTVINLYFDDVVRMEHEDIDFNHFL